MTGYAFQIMDLAGPDLAIVVFGERDCASAFPRVTAEFAGNPRWNVYSAALRESDVVAGRAEDRLRDCLMAVATRMKADANGGTLPVIERRTIINVPASPGPDPLIVVLSTCLSEMTGADPLPVCREVEAATGIRIVTAATSGLRLRTQAEVVDHVGAALLESLGQSGAVDPMAVNLLGYQTDTANDVAWADTMFRAEAARIVSAFGGRLNAAVPAGATTDDWRRLPKGGLTFVSDLSLMGELTRLLAARGSVVKELAQPRGVAASDAFYAGMARALGRDPAPVLESLAARADAVAAVADGRRRFSGMRLAYGIGTVHNFRPDVLAMEGLANLLLFVELGFDVEIVIQERDRPEVHERIRRNLASLGVTAPYRLYYEPAVLEPALREGRFDCAYVADFMRDQVNRAGIPMLRFGDMSSGYGFAGRYVRQITRTLGAIFERRYSSYVGGSGRGGER